jgi:DinB family
MQCIGNLSWSSKAASTIKDIETLYDYDEWANKKLFAVIAQLTPEQFTQPLTGSYGSIRNTLVHAMSGGMRMALALWWNKTRSCPEACGLSDPGVHHSSIEQGRGIPA